MSITATPPQLGIDSCVLHARRAIGEAGLLRLAQYMRERWCARAPTDDAAAQCELSDYLF